MWCYRQTLLITRQAYTVCTYHNWRHYKTQYINNYIWYSGLEDWKTVERYIRAENVATVGEEYIPIPEYHEVPQGNNACQQKTVDEEEAWYQGVVDHRQVTCLHSGCWGGILGGQNTNVFQDSTTKLPPLSVMKIKIFNKEYIIDNHITQDRPFLLKMSIIYCLKRFNQIGSYLQFILKSQLKDHL